MNKNVGKALIIVSVLLLGTLAVASAAAPSVANGTATIDGSIGEWTTSPKDSSNEDWFAPSHLAGKDSKPAVGDVFARYDCSTETMSVLALHRTSGEVQIDQNADETRVEIDGGTIVNSSDSSFAWVNPAGNRADGWEASFTVAKPPANDTPEEHTIRVHYLFDDGGEAGQTADFAGATIDLSLLCTGDGPTAISLSGTLGTSQTSMPMGSIAAIAAVGGLMVATLLVWKRQEN